MPYFNCTPSIRSRVDLDDTEMPISIRMSPPLADLLLAITKEAGHQGVLYVNVLEQAIKIYDDNK